MSSQFDFKKEWEKTKKQLAQFSKEAMEVAKKGEKELIKFSRQGKMHIDSTAVTLKKEHLYYLIGKEYIRSRRSKKANAALEKHIKELEKVNREQRSIKGRARPKQKKKKSANT